MARLPQWAVDETALRDTLSPVLNAWPSPNPYTRIARPYLPNRSGLETILTPDKKMAIVTRAAAFTLTDSDPAFPAFEFGTYVLGQSAKSRLLTKLRHEGGLSYSAGAFSRVSAVDPGATLAGYAICAPENARKALEVMTTEMERWLKEGLDATELAEGQGSYALQLSNELADDAFVARTLAQGLEIDRTLTHKGDLVKAIQNLDLATVKVTLQALLGDKSFHEVLAGDLQVSD